MKLFLLAFFTLATAMIRAQDTRIEAEAFLSQNGTITIPVKDEGHDDRAVGYWNKGDFISFYVNAPKEGVYTFTFRVGTNISDAVYELRDEKDQTIATVTIPNTGSHGTFTSTTASVN